MKAHTTNALIWTFFCLSLAYGLFGRWESTRHVRDATSGASIHLTHDEIILLTLGKNLSKGWDHYHVREWYHQELKAGRNPPAYLQNAPFKHPPMMAMLLALTGAPGLQGARNAFSLMLVLGILAGAAAYALARCVVPPMWSLVAAAVAWVDPVLWGGSVKVWLDLLLTVLCAAAVVFAWHGRTRPLAFLGMGVCLGLAFLTKYPAMIIWAAIVFLLWNDKSFRRGPHFVWGCVLPWLMLLPWLVWNARVSGALNLEELRHVGRLLASPAAWFLALLLGGGFYVWKRAKFPTASRSSGRPFLLALFLLALAGLFFFHSWYSGRTEPRAGVELNFFAGERVWFYVERLFSLDPLLWPGLIALAWIRLPPAANFIRWTTIAFIVVFSIWGNYQSRYIMPVVPLLCALSAWGLFQISEYVSKPGAMWLEKAWLCSWLLFAVLRLNWIHQRLTIPNQMTYF